MWSWALAVLLACGGRAAPSPAGRLEPGLQCSEAEQARAMGPLLPWLELDPGLATRPRPPDPLGQDLVRCAAAGVGAPCCHLRRMEALVPSEATAEGLRAGAEELRLAWEGLTPQRVPRALDLYWALVAGQVLATRTSGLEQLESSLPSSAGPHLRSARALRALSAADPLAAALGRAPLPVAPALPMGVHWTRNPRAAPPLRRIPFGAPLAGLRPIADDPQVDQGLAVLTAAALVDPPRLDLLAGVLERGEPAVLLRWGAANLLMELAPEHPALDLARADAEYMVRAAVLP